jgi:hypothetical protein
MGRSVFLMSSLVLVTQACSNLGQTTVTPEPTSSGGTTGMDAGGGPDIQVKVDVAPPPPTDGATFEAISMPTCVQAKPSVKNVPPDVLIVLDRSSSMSRGTDDQNCSTASGNCANGNKWMQVTTAINTVLPNTQDKVNWGLFFFGDPNEMGTTCNVGTMASVAPGPANAMAIKTAIGGTTPASSTPTTLAMKNAAAYLKTLKDTNPKFILLATDGQPTCGTATSSCTVDAPGSGGVSGSGGAGGRSGAGGRGGRSGTTGSGGMPGGIGVGQFMCDDAAAAAAVKAAHDVDMIPTFVVGIATAGMADATLNRMAINGGFPKLGGGAQQYYSVNSGDELQAALATITTQTKTCFFGIDPAIDDQHKIEKVTADGRELNSTDFMQVGNTGVQLVNQACKDYTDGVIKDVVVQVNCNG